MVDDGERQDGGVGGAAAGAGDGGTARESETTRAMRDWFAGRLDPSWFVEQVEVLEDPDEVLVIGRLAVPPPGEGGESLREAGAIGAFREATRERRMAIAREAEHLFGRQISWGARCGGTRTLFTTLSVPVMTRLRLTERSVLDTLVEAGVARSRSDALAWCVRLVESHESEWLGELREALVGVRRLRHEGPRSL
ncbi:MAG TPA: hypothetical protein VMD59_23315 [Acidimicrobiales bacterium]|nr:hypothetical protein [Acidimicrobiales bacterium]